jgi:DNA-binding XRE family transcriptional regulator
MGRDRRRRQSRQADIQKSWFGETMSKPGRYRTAYCVRAGAVVAEAIEIQVGRRLRARRRLMEMTQAELGRRVGVSFQQIQKYECAAQRMTVTTLWKLARALETDPAYFLSGLKEDAPTP